MSLVYIAFAAHIIHWKLAGKTLAPLELNEVMYTLELGIVTAGFLFMSLLVVGSLLFGRFFCSWACHIMVLQDLCSWILSKLGLGQKPIRSRLLLLVPPVTALYMFAWPQITRAIEQRGFPEFHLQTDAQGWASFATENFWRNLPSIPVVILTFLVCGLVMVYLLGSRSFCTYICPYGAVFGLADRFAPGRIKVNDRCQQCGTCTAACTSGIRVHEELKQHGRVVNPACLKDLDCVGSCPHGALSYGLARPALLASFKSGGRFGKARWDFSWGEELLMALVFVITTLSLRGLYGRIPFLLSLATGAIAALLVITALRMRHAHPVTLARVKLRTASKVAPSGHVYLGCTGLLLLFLGHSALVRFHEYEGLRGAQAVLRPGAQPSQDALWQVWNHLGRAAQLGLLSNERVQRARVDVGLRLGQGAQVEREARRLLTDHPRDVRVHLGLARARVLMGQGAQAQQGLEDLLPEVSDPNLRAEVLSMLGGLAAQERRFEQATRFLEQALRLGQESAATHAELGGAYAELGRLPAAEAQLRRALELDPGLQQAWFNLGGLLAGSGQMAQALPCLQHAVDLAPEDPQAHINLGRVLAALGNTPDARRQLQQAAALDPARTPGRSQR